MFSPYSLTVPGGVQAQIFGLSRALRSEGIDVRVLGPCDGPPPEPGVTPLGMSIPTAANGSVAPIAPDIPAQLRTMRAIWNEDFDVMHLHEPLAPGITTTAILVKTCPIVGTFHAAGTSAAYKWINRGCRNLLGRIDVPVCVSPAAEEMVQNALGGSYQQVFNGVEIGHYLGAKPWPTTGPTIFFVGRHETRKGLAVLLESLAQLPDSVRLWVAGYGPETDALRSQFAQDARIEWLGRISEEEKVARLRGADVFCAPSLHGESFGVVLLEAMAAETAIVASDLESYSRVAQGGKQARLVTPGDPTALATGLRDLLLDPAAAAPLVQAGFERAGDFSMRALAQRYIELYEQAIESRRSPVR